MRVWLPGVAALLQILVLAYIAGEREFVASQGTPVWLRTVPVDPRDLFRGDYVRLRYEASAVPKERWTGSAGSGKALERGARVYAKLTPRADGLMEVSELTDVRPEAGLFIRGRVESHWQAGISVRYGIEAFFTEQGEALRLERQGWADGTQVPLEMEVALGRNGMAVLRGYRYAPLGMRLTVETADSGRRRTGRVTLRLLNASDHPVAVVDPPGHTTLTMVAAGQWQPAKAWRWARAGEARPTAGPQDVHLLAPKEDYTITVDLTQPAWFVTREGEPAPRSLHGLEDWNASFRLQYRPPAPEDCAGLPHAEHIWQGELLSPRFNGMQRLD